MAPTVRSFSAEFEPLGLVARFPERYPGLLESSAPIGAGGGGGRFDILPIACGEALRLSGAGALSGPHSQNRHGFLDALDEWWQTLRIPAEPASLPFTGGWLVYLSYELAAQIEPRLALPRSRDPVAALAVRVPAAWIRDRQSGRCWLSAEPGYEALLERFEDDAGRARRRRRCATPGHSRWRRRIRNNS